MVVIFVAYHEMEHIHEPIQMMLDLTIIKYRYRHCDSRDLGVTESDAYQKPGR